MSEALKNADSENLRTRELLHDLMNELATVKLALHLAKKRQKEADLERFFSKSEDAVLKMETLIDNYRKK